MNYSHKSPLTDLIYYAKQRNIKNQNKKKQENSCLPFDGLIYRCTIDIDTHLFNAIHNQTHYKYAWIAIIDCWCAMCLRRLPPLHTMTVKASFGIYNKWNYLRFSVHLANKEIIFVDCVYGHDLGMQCAVGNHKLCLRCINSHCILDWMWRLLSWSSLNDVCMNQ